MFGKSASTRWNDTIKYLNQNFVGLGVHIDSLVAKGAKQDSISKELSLGSRTDGTDDPAYAQATAQRQALRALLMCQRVYFGADTWCKSSVQTDTTGKVAPSSLLLTGTWKQDSLAYWKQKSEAQIKEGIRMFVPAANPSRDDLQAVAHAGQYFNSAPPALLQMSRTDAPITDKDVTTCYMGIQGWMLLSGIVSLRWVAKNVIPNNKLGCNHVFGVGVETWNDRLADGDKPRVRQMIERIPKGSLVHIWSPQNYNWNGHWVITNGDSINGDGGTVCGVNNAGFSAAKSERGVEVLQKYTNASTLFEQFWGYGGDGESLGKKNAVMEVIDPLNMGEGIRA